MDKDSSNPDIIFIGMEPNCVNFTAKGDYEDKQMLENLISEKNGGCEVLCIKLLPFLGQVRYSLVENHRPRSAVQPSFFDYLNTLASIFLPWS